MNVSVVVTMYQPCRGSSLFFSLQRKDTAKDLETISAANAAIKKLADSFGGTLEEILR